jgi:hypothetical protein
MKPGEESIDMIALVMKSERFIEEFCRAQGLPGVYNPTHATPSISCGRHHLTQIIELLIREHLAMKEQLTLLLGKNGLGKVG